MADEGKTLIYGIGNPLRGDDRLGWLIAEQLQAEVDPERVEVEAVHQLAPELAEPVSRAARVLFIDAAVDLAPGEFQIVPVEPASGTINPFTHGFEPGGLLAAARLLYGKAPEAVLVKIGAGSFELGAGLSPDAARGIAGAVPAVRAWLGEGGKIGGGAIQ